MDYSFDSPNLANQSGRGGDRRSKEYWLTQTTARTMAADVNSERGREVIKFLVARHERLEALEKVGQPTFHLPQSYAEALRQLAGTIEVNEQLKLENAKLDENLEFEAQQRNRAEQEVITVT